MNPLNLRATIGPRGTKKLLFAALSCPLLTLGAGQLDTAQPIDNKGIYVQIKGVR